MIIELLNQVLLRLENLITKLDENGLLSMTRIARSREESLEKYRMKYERQNGHSSSPVSQMDVRPSTTGCHGHVGPEGCDCGYGEDEIDKPSSQTKYAYKGVHLVVISLCC